MIGNNAMVSIVLPVYNGEAHVSKAIESILEQTYKNIELIIVNDCSTDNTLNILEKYMVVDSRIKIVNNLTNLKLPRSLNIGFSQAKGEYFTWTSDDNMYKPIAIEKMVETLQKNKDYDMVYANYTNIDRNDYVLENIQLLPPEHLFLGNSVGACFLYTKDIAYKVGEYDANLFLAEDYDFWIRVMRAGKIMHITDDLYYYRRHSDSLSEKKQHQIELQVYKTMEKNFLFLYSLAKKNKKQYALFDQMLFRLRENDSEEIKKMFYRLDRGYSFHEFVVKMKKNIQKLIVKSDKILNS